MSHNGANGATGMESVISATDQRDISNDTACTANTTTAARSTLAPDVPPVTPLHPSMLNVAVKSTLCAPAGGDSLDPPRFQPMEDSTLEVPAFAFLSAQEATHNSIWENVNSDCTQRKTTVINPVADELSLEVSDEDEWDMSEKMPVLKNKSCSKYPAKNSGQKLRADSKCQQQQVSVASTSLDKEADKTPFVDDGWPILTSCRRFTPKKDVSKISPSKKKDIVHVIDLTSGDCVDAMDSETSSMHDRFSEIKSCAEDSVSSISQEISPQVKAEMPAFDADTHSQLDLTISPCDSPNPSVLSRLHTKNGQVVEQSISPCSIPQGETEKLRTQKKGFKELAVDSQPPSCSYALTSRGTHISKNTLSTSDLLSYEMIDPLYTAEGDSEPIDSVLDLDISIPESRNISSVSRPTFCDMPATLSHAGGGVTTVVTQSTAPGTLQERELNPRTTDTGILLTPEPCDTPAVQACGTAIPVAIGPGPTLSSSQEPRTTLSSSQEPGTTLSSAKAQPHSDTIRNALDVRPTDDTLPAFTSGTAVSPVYVPYYVVVDRRAQSEAVSKVTKSQLSAILSNMDSFMTMKETKDDGCIFPTTGQSETSLLVTDSAMTHGVSDSKNILKDSSSRRDQPHCPVPIKKPKSEDEYGARSYRSAKTSYPCEESSNDSTDFQLSAKSNSLSQEDTPGVRPVLVCEACENSCQGKSCGQCSEGHVICQSCIEEEVRAVMISDTPRMLCPVLSCSHSVSYDSLTNVLPNLVLDLLRRHLAKKEHMISTMAIRKMEGMVSCPSCSYCCLMDEGDMLFRCGNTNCTVQCCRYCKSPWGNNMTADVHKYCQLLGSVGRECLQDISQLPDNWNILPCTQAGVKKDFAQFRIPLTSSEGMAIVRLFNSSCKRPVKGLWRIQNKRLWEKYVLKRKHMEEKIGGSNLKEMYLFHGTRHNNIVPICTEGFDMRVPTANGAVLGKGIYFSTKATYAGKFSDSSAIFIVRVLCGLSTLGAASYTRPPKDSTGRLFDSVVDNLSVPSKYVIFDNDQCYPEIIVEYHGSC